MLAMLGVVPILSQFLQRLLLSRLWRWEEGEMQVLDRMDQRDSTSVLSRPRQDYLLSQRKSFLSVGPSRNV